MTQDLGTAVERFKQNDIQKLIYTVGNEQDYHFQVLFLILKKIRLRLGKSIVSPFLRNGRIARRQNEISVKEQ